MNNIIREIINTIMPQMVDGAFYIQDKFSKIDINKIRVTDTGIIKFIKKQDVMMNKKDGKSI
jgi:hypothetical protein